jgi:sulfur-carrier protein
MQITVKLFSTLREYCPSYDPEHGVQLQLPAGACLRDLITQLQIPAAKAPVATCAGRIVRADDLLEEGSLVHLFQPVAGG